MQGIRFRISIALQTSASQSHCTSGHPFGDPIRVYLFTKEKSLIGWVPYGYTHEFWPSCGRICSRVACSVPVIPWAVPIRPLWSLLLPTNVGLPIGSEGVSGGFCGYIWEFHFAFFGLNIRNCNRVLI
jgi:hypothetical protein